MIKPPLDLFPQGLKIQIRVIVMFRVSTQLFLPITSQNLSKIQNSISEDYASLQWFQGQSPKVKQCSDKNTPFTGRTKNMYQFKQSINVKFFQILSSSAFFLFVISNLPEKEWEKSYLSFILVGKSYWLHQWNWKFFPNYYFTNCFNCLW